MSELRLSAQARALHLRDASTTAPTLEELAAWLARMGKRREVDWVEAQLELGEGLRLPLAVSDRGRVFSVDFGAGKTAKRRRYALSVDGLQSAVADWIREEHNADPALLDLFERLLIHG